MYFEHFIVSSVVIIENYITFAASKEKQTVNYGKQIFYIFLFLLLL